MKTKQRVPESLIIDTFASLGITDLGEMQHFIKGYMKDTFRALDLKWNKLTPAERKEFIDECFWAPLHSEIYAFLEDNELGICAFN